MKMLKLDWLARVHEPQASRKRFPVLSAHTTPDEHAHASLEDPNWRNYNLQPNFSDSARYANRDSQILIFV